MQCMVYLSQRPQVMKFDPALVIIYYGHPVNTANFFGPIGDRINEVPLYINSTKIYTKTWNAHIDSE